jgi:hypothetical protein
MFAFAGAKSGLCYPFRYPEPLQVSISLTHYPHKHLILKVERVKGIEPSSSAWKAVVPPALADVHEAIAYFFDNLVATG